MIKLITGSVGEGKSYNSIAIALDHLRSGGVVASNFGLSEGWPRYAARKTFFDLFDTARIVRRQRDMWSRWFKVGTVRSILDLSSQLPDLVTGLQAKRVAKHGTRAGRPESLGLLILDEGHIFFNSRDWRNNMPLIHFLSQSRKKGWDVIIIAHHEDMIDSQIRQGLINEVMAMRNLANVQCLPLIPLRFKHLTLGKPLFLGISKLSGNGGGKGVVTERKLRCLSKDVSSIYETMEEFNYLDQIDVAENIGSSPSQEIRFSNKSEYLAWKRKTLSPSPTESFPMECG